jgi:hypothetical protein
MTQHYSLHSNVAAVEAWPALADAIHARLEPFAVDTAARPSLEIAFTPAHSAAGAFDRAPGRRVYDFPDGEVTYDDDRDLLTIAVGDRIRAVCEPGPGRAHVAIRSPQPSDLYLLSHPVLSLLLMELLKRRGLFPLHAAGLALDDRGVLLAGTSGAGKSTLSVALARAGFAFLSDDTVFLEADAPGWRVRAFPDQIDLCADAADLFPELRRTIDGPVPPNWRKRQIRAESMYGSAISWAARPQTLIFPRVAGRPRSTIRRISPEEALLELAPNVLLTEPAVSQQHLDALAGLASQCACFRLETGRELDDAVAVVRAAAA